MPNESVFARRTIESDAWKQWENSSGKLALVVDGVDEELVKILGFVSYLSVRRLSKSKAVGMSKSARQLIVNW
ncbi:MAG: hypothetical protein PHY43_04425 [Verrucomicrobiales bacterium]|nr:hypothetical protein [Verrucomicrobiales bacterium]